VSVDITPQEAMKRLEQHFGSSRRNAHSHADRLVDVGAAGGHHVSTGDKPILDVRVSTKLGAAWLYGLESRLPRLLRRIEFSNGAVAGSQRDLDRETRWPMEGFSQAELDAVDLAQGDERMGPGGETLRKMIRKNIPLQKPV